MIEIKTNDMIIKDLYYWYLIDMHFETKFYNLVKEGDLK